ncbi:hypothetical protein I317_02470 [Kwoniella heveanensis CBS 569]|nr:hypothetical protein I317_02470 [Kwoniella heveanensis CBS 569]
MLISPSRIHSTLSSLLGNANSNPEATTSSSSSSGATHEGVHTALLITPQGQLISSANLPPSEEDEGDEGEEREEGDPVPDGANGNIFPSRQGENGENDSASAEEEEGEGDEEPYLETQERRRLLLGLASQWDQSESSKMECELGRLHFTYIQLDYPTQPSSTARDHLPTPKPPFVDGFVLVLNGDKAVPWSAFSSKVGLGFGFGTSQPRSTHWLWEDHQTTDR